MRVLKTVTGCNRSRWRVTWPCLHNTIQYNIRLLGLDRTQAQQSVVNRWPKTNIHLYTACAWWTCSRLSVVCAGSSSEWVTISESTRCSIKPARSSPSAVRSRCSCTSRSIVCQQPVVARFLSQPPFLEHSARRRAVCIVCLFHPATAKDIPVSPVISRHHSLNFRTTLSWTLQQFRLF